MKDVSIVIPALNEAMNIAGVLRQIPHEELAAAGWRARIVLVDNGSTDGTGEIAESLGATVVRQNRRGYGHAYRAGFSAATGDVIATGDADGTYPFDALPALLGRLDAEGLDFLSTYRLGWENHDAMTTSHVVGNHALTMISRTLFNSPFRDSQSGMWIFRRAIWPHLDCRSGGMGFSQELKNEAHAKGFVCAEERIVYRNRGGEPKLSTAKDGARNLAQLLVHRARLRGAVSTEASTTPRRLVIAPVADAPSTSITAGMSSVRTVPGPREMSWDGVERRTRPRPAMASASQGSDPSEAVGRLED